MKALLLYPDREWIKPEFYFDEKNITQDLGLNTLCTVASKEVIYENGEVKKLSDPDLYIKSVMHMVMLTPLKTPEEIYYRQRIVADCIANEELIKDIYSDTTEMLGEWDRLGRNVKGRNSGRDNMSKLITRIYEFRLFLSTLEKISDKLKKALPDLKSEGLRRLYTRLSEEFPQELRDELEDISNRIAFFVTDEVYEGDAPMVSRPYIVLECGVGHGSKCGGFKLKELTTVEKRYRDPKSAIAKVQDYFGAFVPDSVSCESGPVAKRQAAAIEYSAVSYAMSFVEPFMRNFEQFFDAVHFQSAFYVGAVTLEHHMKRFAVKYCYPKVVGPERLAFIELKEFVMCIEQRVNAVGNTCTIDPKQLIIITGANQGGKSTFLRSIGIAQAMMQCGLPVAAVSFESGIFTSLFMHFTRREDSQMNSGRLDEELGRMNQIVNNLKPDSLILLNESFATTTERDGSAICYDIIKALKEAGVKIITVTHLLSFAQKIYAESKEQEDAGIESKVTFFCAERMSDGKRTFKMKQSVPELTSFGLDLYESIIEGKKQS